MALSLTHDIVATIGEYTDAQGQKKKRYATCGKAFTDDEGRVSLKIDVVPVVPGWSGWLSLYPIERDSSRQSTAPKQEPKNRNIPSNREHPPDNIGEEEDIPF